MSDWDEMWKTPFYSGGDGMEVTTKTDGKVAQTKARKAAASIHGLDQAETIARRIKDAGALENALIAKLESQRDFATEYQNKFPHGVRADRRDDSTVVSNGDDWCLSFGFHVRTVQRWCELVRPEKYLEKKTAVLKRCWELAELWQAANFMSDSVEWYTPARYLEAVRQVLGGIDLDPASNFKANGIIGATAIFTKDDDGLKKQWHGRVFMNPPYGKTEEGDSLAATFCRKAADEYESGNIDACIILVNSLHSQAWQAPLYKYVICFVDHRIQFISGDGEQNKNPTFQNIFVYLGKDTEKFAAVFSRFGYVMRQIEEAA